MKLYLVKPRDRTTAPQPPRRPGLLADRRGAIAIVFAVCLLPLVITVSAGIDFARLADSRAAMQQAVDNAALSGAAAYSVNATAAQTKALVSAQSTFCQMTVKMPAGTALTGGNGKPCNGSAGGPIVTAQIAGFVAGTPGITPSACSASNPVVSGVTCGFIVTVSATVSMASSLSGVFGASKAMTVTGIAANPFLNIGTAMTASVTGNAYNNNSVWVYPLLLDSNGNPNFAANPGAIPGLPSGFFPADASPSGCVVQTGCGAIGSAAGPNCASSALQQDCAASPPSGSCWDSPSQFTCGAFTMLASTYYNSSQHPCPASSPCYPLGVGNYPTIIQGIIQNPQAPTAVITATTPIGIAFQSISGGTTSFGTSGLAANGCLNPTKTVYTTYSQVPLSSNASTALVDGPKVTHWFYSSYLANGYPPSEGEILSQANPLTGPRGVLYNTRVPTVNTVTQAANVACTLSNPLTGQSYDSYILTSYPSTGATNASLFISSQPAGSAYVPPSSANGASARYTPANTPGAQYAALSCQAYGSNVFTFYWNDMGGGAGPPGNDPAGDDLDYNNGTVRIACSGVSFVLLIG